MCKDGGCRERKGAKCDLIMWKKTGSNATMWFYILHMDCLNVRERGREIKTLVRGDRVTRRGCIIFFVFR